MQKKKKIQVAGIIASICYRYKGQTGINYQREQWLAKKDLQQ